MNKWVIKLFMKEKKPEVVNETDIEREIHYLEGLLHEITDPVANERYSELLTTIERLEKIREMQSKGKAKVRKWNVDGSTIFIGILSTGQLIMTMLGESKGIVIPGFLSKMIWPLGKKMT